MSEDVHNSDNDPTVCCIFECGDPSTVCLDGRWYCDKHGKEYEIERRADGTGNDMYHLCQRTGCENRGLVQNLGTGNWYCIDHAYAADRTDEYGLSHPDNPTQYTATGEVQTEIQKRDAKYAIPAKKKLEDEGTRYQHIADFQDYLADGLQATINSLSRYNNESDILRKLYLEKALELVEVYQMKLAEYESKKWDLYNKVLDKCVPSREVIAQIKADKEHEAAKRKIEHEQKEKSEEKSDGTR